MPGCQCAGSSCSCKVVGGAGVTVTGIGSADRPYAISSLPTYDYAVVDESTYVVGGDGILLGDRTVVSVTFAGMLGIIMLPGSDPNVPLPPVGSEVVAFVNGDPSGSYTFGGPVIGWVGPPPSGSGVGFYRFILFAEPDPIWRGQFLVA